MPECVTSVMRGGCRQVHRGSECCIPHRFAWEGWTPPSISRTFHRCEQSAYSDPHGTLRSPRHTQIPTAHCLNSSWMVTGLDAQARIPGLQISYLIPAHTPSHSIPQDSQARIPGLQMSDLILHALSFRRMPELESQGYSYQLWGPDQNSTTPNTLIAHSVSSLAANPQVGAPPLYKGDWVRSESRPLTLFTIDRFIYSSRYFPSK